jgi:hypothetical protein
MRKTLLAIAIGLVVLIKAMDSMAFDPQHICNCEDPLSDTEVEQCEVQK